MVKMLFTPVPRILKDIIMEVENGKLGLPELQRGYVWKATKVRDLLDSMMKGYPIGYLMIWDSSDSEELTEAEKRLIDERLEAYHKNPEAGSPWEEVYQRILKSYES